MYNPRGYWSSEYLQFEPAFSAFETIPNFTGQNDPSLAQCNLEQATGATPANACGTVSLAAILYNLKKGENPPTPADVVATVLQHRTSCGPMNVVEKDWESIVGYPNEYVDMSSLGQRFFALSVERFDWHAVDMDTAFNVIRTRIVQSESKWPAITIGLKSDGTLGSLQEGVSHIVVITGLTTPDYWTKDTRKWVRVYNPWRNDIQFYRAEDIWGWSFNPLAFFGKGTE